MSYLRVKITRLDESQSLVFKRIEDFDANESVGSLFPKVLDPEESAEAFDIQCICCGELLEENKRLSDYDIDAYSVLQFLIKPKSRPTVGHAIADSVNPVGTDYVLTSIRWTIRSGQLNKVIGLLTQRDYLDRSIVTNPGLGLDVLAYSVLQDSKLLNTLFRDRGSLEKFLKEHPSVVPVVYAAIQSVSGPNGDPRRGYSSSITSTSMQSLRPPAQDYTIDQEQDNDAEDDNDANQRGAGVPLLSSLDGAQHPERSSPARSSGMPATGISPRVSRHQLQAAIAQAQGLLTTGGAGGGAQRRTSPRIESSNEPAIRASSNFTRITRSALTQALASATSSLQHTNQANPMVTETPRDSSDRWASQLAQLIEMGVSDLQAARQALEVTNGDLSLALQILFG